MSDISLPASLRAGDHLSFSASLSDYPAGTWTLSYALVKSATRITFSATADGTTHVVAVSPSTTANYAVGAYTWVAYVSKSGSRVTLETGAIEILPDLASASSGYDARSHARKVLDAISAVIENRATLDQQQYSIAGRQLVRTPLADLLALRSQYEAMVKAEEAADRVNQGLSGRRRLLTRLA